MSEDQFRLTPDAFDQIRQEVRQTFVPSKPIKSQELLFGRAAELKRTLDTLEVPGRSVFIYGERGVGKTSLAQTAAYLFNSSHGEPVIVSCHPQQGFGQLMSQICRRLLRVPFFRASKRTTEVGAKTVVHLLHRIEHESQDLPDKLDINDAVDLLNEIGRRAPANRSVVVVDEMDQGALVRPDIAHLMKQMGDRECPIKFIFVGIADNVDDLLEHHESASRYMGSVGLERLPFNVLQEMVVRGFDKLGIRIWEQFGTRIACISDGFAHFTHLVALKLVMRVVDDNEGKLVVSPQNLDDAFRDAVQDSEAWLRRDYDLAVKKYQDKYEPALWAAADHWQLERSTEHMYPAYQRICAELAAEALPRQEFSKLLYNLKQENHGRALVSTRKSWYRFRQTMLRGYCRMMAATRGVDVGVAYLETK